MPAATELAQYCLNLAKTPIVDGNFAGEDMRYFSEYERLEAELGKASSLHQPRAVDWQEVRAGCERLLATRSKDLRVACWLAWSLHQGEGVQGLQAGVGLLDYLCEHHWAELHPRKPRTRAAAINWLLPRLEQALAEHVPLGGQLPLLRTLADHLRRLEGHLSSHLGEEAPLLLPLCRRLESQIDRATQGHIAPVPVLPPVAPTKKAHTQSIPGISPIENERDAHKAFRALESTARPVCAWWLKHKATDVKPLRLARTLLWLSIEALPERNAEHITVLRSPSADSQAAYQGRFEQGLYADLLVDVEATLANAPFWLDGQRLAWECLQALKASHAMREVEIQLALFLYRVPGIETLRFHDGAPFANAQTCAWISSHVLPHVQAAPTNSMPPATEQGASPPWDVALQQALPLLQEKGLKVAAQSLKQGLDTSQGGRQRFFWQLAQARLCFAAKKYDLAKTQLEALDQALQTSGRAEWEPDLMLDVLRLLHRCCEVLPQNHEVRASKDGIYRRLCHLDLQEVLD
ncbi:type VI secretion system protein TssA [Pseudomonas typographi]|uniref:type VI secretion system protein TssA n=1 Tax=Pseudomonas typographi TaxID=2715964 RepID=UPI001683EEDF|nr:type VI secretion system protein TssA [Pseudomonas typographi]MBD1553191.1 type VI secretion system protein TssA [Pseudomonas typographi]MBD1588070.1 type VI secretion system protein TssA [Pseudomonas typographi]